MKINQLQDSNLIQDTTFDQAKNKSNKDFSQLLQSAVHKVDDLQKESEVMSQKLAVGEVDNVHQVMISSAKAKLALDLTLEVRNKVVDSYNQIMRMQV
ncbi:MAG: flagellar hook-basal body complex protein FliE [Bacillota bacterium]